MKKMKIRIYALLVVAVLTAFPVMARAADPVVEAVQKRYAGISGIRADFIQTLTHKQNGRVEKREGVFHFAKPGNIRWEVKTPVPEIQLVTPSAIWNIFPDEDMAYKYSPGLPKELRGVMDLVTGQSALTENFDVEKGGEEGGIVKLLLYPKMNSDNPMTMAELYADAKTGTITRVLVVDLFHNRNDIVFTSQVFDPVMPDGIFTFTPPKGMKVEDKTGDNAAGKPLLQ